MQEGGITQKHAMTEGIKIVNDVVMKPSVLLHAEDVFFQFVEAFAHHFQPRERAHDSKSKSANDRKKSNRKVQSDSRKMQADLDAYLSILTNNLWPEKYSICRSKQREFKRLWHCSRFVAIDGELLFFVNILFRWKNAINCGRSYAVNDYFFFAFIFTMTFLRNREVFIVFPYAVS